LQSCCLDGAQALNLAQCFHQ